MDFSENVILSVLGMRGGLSGLAPGGLEWFVTVLDERLRAIYARLTPTLPLRATQLSAAPRFSLQSRYSLRELHNQDGNSRGFLDIFSECDLCSDQYRV